MGFFWGTYGGNIRLYSLVFHRLWGWCVHIFFSLFLLLVAQIFLDLHWSPQILYPGMLSLVSYFFHYGVTCPKHVRGSPLHGSVFMSCALAIVHLKRAHQTCSSDMFIRHVLAGIWEGLLVQCQYLCYLQIDMFDGVTFDCILDIRGNSACD